jgi:hypothetical protein
LKSSEDGSLKGDKGDKGGESFDPFGVRGRHLTLSFTQLPTWLPESHANEMLKRFSKTLVEELPGLIERYVMSQEVDSDVDVRCRRPSNALTEAMSQAPSATGTSSSGGHLNNVLGNMLRRFGEPRERSSNEPRGVSSTKRRSSSPEPRYPLTHDSRLSPSPEPYGSALDTSYNSDSELSYDSESAYIS